MKKKFKALIFKTKFIIYSVLLRAFFALSLFFISFFEYLVFLIPLNYSMWATYKQAHISEKQTKLLIEIRDIIVKNKWKEMLEDSQKQKETTSNLVKEKRTITIGFFNSFRKKGFKKRDKNIKGKKANKFN